MTLCRSHHARDLARLLIGHGADVNATNGYNRTALYYAAKHGHHSVAGALIAAGAKERAIVEANCSKTPQLAATQKEGDRSSIPRVIRSAGCYACSGWGPCRSATRGC